MMTLQTRTHVAGLTAEQVYRFLVNATDSEYQAWWPGVHLRLHTLRRYPNDIGNVVFMDEFIGEYRVALTGLVIEAIPATRLVWQLKKGVRLPVRLVLELHNSDAGVDITHKIHAGFRGLGRVFDRAWGICFSRRFVAAMDAHVKAEFPRLREMLGRTAPT